MIAAGHRQPDIVAKVPGVGMIIIETEWKPAHSVEDDALARFAQTDASDRLQSVLAVRLPTELRNAPQREVVSLLDRAGNIEFCKFAPDRHSAEPVRYPEAGWLNGSCDDLAGFTESALVSHTEVEQAAERMERAIEQVAGALRSDLSSKAKSGVLKELADQLHQEDGEQTTRMAATILLNALVFHEAISGAHGVRSPSRVRSETGRELLPDDLVQEWDQILKVNYYPIFRIARDLMMKLPAVEGREAIIDLREAAAHLIEAGLTRIQDLSGQVFGRLIADRKFLATFYTLPSSAALLAELAVPRLKVDWSDPEEVASLRIADLACGTGALLSAAYRSLSGRVRRRGVDDLELHPRIMDRVLTGADIMPAAVHLTASVLSSHHPSSVYQGTDIHLLPYGEVAGTGGGLAVGSLELLDDESKKRSLLGTGRQAVTGVGMDDTLHGEAEINLPHSSVDLVIMNPPFTRPTSHEVAEVPVPSFAGFGNSEDEQRGMSNRLKKLTRGLSQPVGHGNAGLASNFIDLAHTKVARGGTIAFVLPATFISGGSWTKARSLIAEHYRDVVVVTIAAHGITDRAFSADTGMAECLVVATRKDEGQDQPNDDCLWVNLNHRPRSSTEGIELARVVRTVEGSNGQVRIGDQAVGVFVRAGLQDGGCAQLSQPDIASAALGLVKHSRLRLPRVEDVPLPLVQLGELGSVGPFHLDIRGFQADRKTPRGPFDIRDLPEGRRASYPCLWEHKSAREKHLVVLPDTEGLLREGMSDKAREVWATASRLHFNQDFRLNSQSLAACLTPEPSLGGRAWPTLLLNDPDQRRCEKALLLWANTTLGMISFWWIGTRQQGGRAIVSISRLKDLTVLDPRELSDDQLTSAELIFDEFKERDLRPLTRPIPTLFAKISTEPFLSIFWDYPSKFLSPWQSSDTSGALSPPFTAANPPAPMRDLSDLDGYSISYHARFRSSRSCGNGMLCPTIRGR